MEDLTVEEYTSMIASNDYWIDQDTMEWLFHFRYEAMSYEDSMATGLPSQLLRADFNQFALFLQQYIVVTRINDLVNTIQVIPTQNPS